MIAVHGCTLLLVANIQEIRVEISGLDGGPGVAIFYAGAVDTTAVAALVTFYSSVKNLHPNGVSFVVPGSGDLINEANGEIVGAWTQSGSGTQTSTAAVAAYAAGVGARVRWDTAGIVHKRRVRGSTFLVPLLAANYENNGTILAAAMTTINNAAAALVSTADLLIWSRPFAGAPNNPARSGVAFGVAAGVGVDKVATLRSRRT